MKKLSFIVLIVLACSIVVSSQVRGRPDPTPLTQAEKAVARSKDITNRSNELRNVENFPNRDVESNKLFRKSIKPLYRKPNKKELKLVAPSAEMRQTHKTFLKGKNQGLIKLIKDVGCADRAGVVNASPSCSNYTMPGAGSAYSFRIKNYRMKNLSDLNFTGKNFEALGVLLHGVMVDLGDVAIEDVDQNSDAARYIKSLKPATDFKEAAEFATKLQKGIEQNGFTYASVLPAKSNSTYILRSIAYRGMSVRKIQGVAYNELEFDKRKDVTIVFKVVEKADNDITIIWKQLESSKSPVLEVGG